MRYRGLVIVCAALAWGTGAWADNRFPDQLEQSGVQFYKCSDITVRVLGFIRIGWAALYLDDCQTNSAPLQRDRLLTIEYDRSFSSEDFQVSSLELLKRNTSSAVFDRIQQEAIQFGEHYRGVSDGDRYRVVYTQASGLELVYNDETLLARSQSDLLASHYFSIWFGEKPFSRKMRDKLLKPVLSK